MTTSTDYLDFILDQLSSWKTIHPKRMFGVIGLYADGYMFGIISKEMVYFKVANSNQAHYKAADAQSLKLFKNNSVVASFYEVPIAVLEDADQLTIWAEASLNIQKKNSSKK
ncbi:TfoX/Sxy family protein [Psychroserpens damuponensis]|uniref:TfoX/Sxy family protein n=1 Tax=Psychroserpens damuponensis TaxID=943936 RepID=UPI00058E927F|nr:TfoX/Sxy family protein [Psychroserpens damuponensis]